MTCLITSFPLYLFSRASLAACLCGGSNSCNLTLDNQTIYPDTSYTACETITLGPNFAVGTSGTLELESGIHVNINPESAVESTGQLRIVIDPNLACDGDNDFDWFNQCMDCDDSIVDIFPGAIEVCDGVDNDCDGDVDERDICTPCFEPSDWALTSTAGTVACEATAGCESGECYASPCEGCFFSGVNCSACTSALQTCNNVCDP